MTCNFVQIRCWEHLGNNIEDIVTDAPFVGNQSRLMQFDITQDPDSGNDRQPVLLIDLLRSGDSTPTVTINGNAINSPMTNVGLSNVWQLWMINFLPHLIKGTNTIQIFRQTGGDNFFVINNLTLFWHVSNEASSSEADSSGWLNITADRWKDIAGAGKADFTAPQDKDRLAVSSWWAGTNGLGYNSDHSIISMYIDDQGARQVPFRRYVSGGGKSGVVEFRYVFDTDPNFAKWLSPVVALVEGDWDRDGYIKNTYLPSLKWRVATIPAF